MPKAADATRAEIEALYEKLVATNPAIPRKGATMPYTSVNGNMFSVLTKAGRLALRLPEGEREAFLKMYDTTLCEQYGIVMKEYVEVPDALLRKTQALKKYFDISYEYACSLKPKPTTRSQSKPKPKTKTKAAAGAEATQKPAKRTEPKSTPTLTPKSKSKSKPKTKASKKSR